MSFITSIAVAFHSFLESLDGSFKLFRVLGASEDTAPSLRLPMLQEY